LWSLCCSILVFSVVFCRSLFVFLSFIYNFYQSTSRNHIWSQKSNTPVPLVEQELVNIPKHLFFVWSLCCSILVFSVVFCRSLFIFLSFIYNFYQSTSRNHIWSQKSNTPVPLVEQELVNIPKHLFFCGVCVAQSLVFSVVFCRSLFVFLSFIYNFYQSTSRNHIWSQKSNTPVPLVEQELVNIPKHLFFCGVCVAQS
jgi:phosphoribosyl-AMP cyclohydrolase